MSFLPLNAIFSAPLTLQIGYFAASLLIGLLGRDRLMGFWGYFFGSILFSPIVGLLLLIISGKKRTNEGQD